MLTLSPDAAIMFVLALTSAMLFGSLLVSWRMLGGGRQALFWAGAFGVAAVQWAIIGGYNSFAEETAAAFVGTTWAGAAMSVLLCIGYRERINAPRHARLAVATLVVAFLMIALPYGTGLYLNIPLAVPQLVRALCLPIAALTLIGPGRRPNVVELMNAAVLLAFALFSAVVSGFRLTDCGCETNQARTTLLLGLPVLFTGTGLAAVLLLAADLARLLRRAARVDPLTEALNRRGFEEAATRILAHAARHPRPVSVVLFDLDHFKRINDNFGHARGDAVLQAVAASVRGEIREGDLYGRIGGEEFALLFDGSAMAEAVATAERIRLAIGQLTTLPDKHRVTASFGVAVVPGEDLSTAFRHADGALYQAKSVGRNCTRRYIDISDHSVLSAPESAAHPAQEPPAPAATILDPARLPVEDAADRPLSALA